MAWGDLNMDQDIRRQGLTHTIRFYRLLKYWVELDKPFKAELSTLIFYKSHYNSSAAALQGQQRTPSSYSHKCNYVIAA